MKQSPTFPPEIWREILRLAVYVPGQLETKWDCPPDLIMWQGWERWGHPETCGPIIADSLRTKLSICLVSKSWREIGVELLYEHLFFTDHAVVRFDISKVVSIFEKHPSYGRSTKRIDIPNIALDKYFYQDLIHLLEFCSKICIFIVSAQEELDDSEERLELSAILQNRFRHSLRQFEFYVPDKWYSLYLEYEHPIYLPDVPLDSLEMSIGSNLIADPSSLAIATVSTLCLNLPFSNHVPPPWQFPGLRHLTLKGLRDDYFPLLQPFLSIHVPQLLSLHFTHFSNEKFTLLPKILPATNLQCLVVPADTLGRLTVDDIFPSLTHIGLVSDSFIERIPEWLVNSTLPSLQCIKLLNHSTSLENRINPDDESRWNELLELARTRNIRFEDKNRPVIQVEVPKPDPLDLPIAAEQLLEIYRGLDSGG